MVGCYIWYSEEVTARARVYAACPGPLSLYQM